LSLGKFLLGISYFSLFLFLLPLAQTLTVHSSDVNIVASRVVSGVALVWRDGWFWTQGWIAHQACQWSPYPPPGTCVFVWYMFCHAWTGHVHATVTGLPLTFPILFLYLCNH